MKLLTIVLQKNELGQLRIRADMEVDTEYGKTTISRQMEDKLPVETVNALKGDFDGVSAWIDENGIPTQ